MTLVLITGDGPEHHYVANQISKAHETAAILVCDPPARRSWKTVLRKNPQRFLGKVLRQLYLRAIGDADARKAQLRAVLGPEAEGFEQQALVRHAGRPKGEELERLVRDLKPTVLAIYGTGIIPDTILELAGDVALNMHTGLSPDYRGVACAFWPIRDERPDMVGATVHECTSDVDGGLIYFKAAARLHPDDGLHAVFARAVLIGAQGYVQTVGQALEGHLTGTPQDLTQGQEFTGAQLGIKTELQTRAALRRLRRSGRLAPKAQ